MEFQSTQFENELKNRGWIISAKEICPEWWADELWVLESIWSPLGVRAHITFLVDPQIDVPSKRKKGQQVWAVSVSASKPRGPFDGDHALPLGRGWRSGLPEFFDMLDRFRA